MQRDSGKRSDFCDAVAADVMTLYSRLTFPIDDADAAAAAWRDSGLERVHFAASALVLEQPHTPVGTVGLFLAASTYLQLPSTVAVDGLDFGILLAYFAFFTQPPLAAATGVHVAPNGTPTKPPKTHLERLAVPLTPAALQCVAAAASGAALTTVTRQMFSALVRANALEPVPMLQHTAAMLRALTRVHAEAQLPLVSADATVVAAAEGKALHDAFAGYQRSLAAAGVARPTP